VNLIPAVALNADDYRVEASDFRLSVGCAQGFYAPQETVIADSRIAVKLMPGRMMGAHA
jgi:hypothetical protein